MTTRRAFVLAAGAWGALTVTWGAFAQSKAPILIGYLTLGTRESVGPGLDALKEGLAALGWNEGSQIVFEARWADGKPERLAPIAEELASKKPAIIVASALAAVCAAAKAAPQTPIVQQGGGDLVLANLAKSFAQPGGMVTGVTNTSVDLTAKYVELLMTASPKLQRIGVLLDGTTTRRTQVIDMARRAAARYSVELRIAEAANPDEIGAAMSRLAKEGAQALMLPSSGMLNVERRRIAKAALEQRWPLIAYGEPWAESGALLAYGADALARSRRAAYYVDRILKGTKPGDLPIEQPTQFVLVVNLKTAKALGLTISQDLLLRAHKVIE
jgi:putative tryptophan/tyrosine transport system substrate-binding protein